MEKITVFVVGFEGTSNFGTSFWDWYLTKESAESRKIELESDIQLQKNGLIYGREITVNNSEDKEDITVEVEQYLERNNWENAF